MVNAANEGCLAGGGIDGAIVKAGGGALAEARRALPICEGTHGIRCPTGDARITIGGSLPTAYCIHAVGPDYSSQMRSGASLAACDALVSSAYKSALKCAQEKKLASVGFSLLSAGVFRGPQSLENVLKMGVLGIRDGWYVGLDEVHLVAFSKEELPALQEVCSALSRVEWFSWDSRTEEWVAYEDGATAWLEKQYKNGSKGGNVRVGGIVYDMDFTHGDMWQINAEGNARPVERVAEISSSIRHGHRASPSAGLGVKWRSLDPRTNTWVDYSPTDSSKLEKEYQQGKENCMLELGGSRFLVEFTSSNMKQVNERGNMRPVERVIESSAVAQWRSFDPKKGDWMQYGALESAALEAKYQAGEKVCKLRIGGLSFDVEFTPGRMRQVNRHGKSRKVERVLENLAMAQWRSLDPRNGEWVDYGFDAALTLEEQYQSGEESGMVVVSGVAFVVYFVPPMRQVNADGVCRDVQRIGVERDATASRCEHVTEETFYAGEASSPAQRDHADQKEHVRPVLYTKSKGWMRYDPDPLGIVVIGPGAGTRQNKQVYDGLRSMGFNVSIVYGGSYDQYPRHWQSGYPDVASHHGHNLASLADDMVYPLIADLVKKGRGPAVLIAGSRGGQVTTPRLWRMGWQGPTIIINAGCVGLTVVPDLPVSLALYTCGQDFFRTKDPLYTKRSLRRRNKDRHVLLYHDPEDGHMPDTARLHNVLHLLVEVTRTGLNKDNIAKGQWPSNATVALI
eukprot:TRINITY_DN88654_c0_g1_i1.p1 TRINITY_DN88654_c0_g1~~TRINITY_DN88654_c0_g1_i1.p1  ORF type:complete len:810 (+),score=96.53 TRINITY_DN88654_c0_g1_i1:222-2432(+)